VFELHEESGGASSSNSTTYTMSKEIDYGQAEELLRETWREVSNSDETEYVEDHVIRQGINQIIQAEKRGTRTFRYILLTNVLAKAVNPDIHALALKDQSDLEVSFNSGGLATNVVTEWEKDNGERLGGSNEPRTASIYYRQSELNEDYDAQIKDLYQTLIRVLSELQEQSENGSLEPLNVLRQTLSAVSLLEPTTVSYSNPPEVSYIELEEVVQEYLERSGTGERLAAVAAGVLDAQYFQADRSEVYIKVDHVNVADESSSAAGDIEVFESDEEGHLIRAAEVKDKPATKSDIQHSISTGREHELDEYLFIIGQGFRSESEKSKAMQVVKDAEIELIIISKDDLLSSLRFQGRGGRRKFRESVGEFLNDMRAQENSKSDWKEAIESLGE